MLVRQIDTQSRQDIARFVKFPFELYRDSPYWVPPLLSDAKAELNRGKHPFYEHSNADFFLAEHDGQTVGRISVMENSRYNDFYGSRTAFFGHLEMVDDRQVSGALFKAAFDWARERGLQDIRGPKELFGANGGGILVQGFEYSPALGMPYHYAYYDRLVQAAGLTKTQDSLSGYFRRDHYVPERFFQIADKARARRGYWIKSFDSKREMHAWVPRAAEVFRQSFEGMADYFPPSDAEIAAFAQTIISVAEPGLIKLVMKSDEIIGFLFVYPNISEGLKKARGRLLPWGWYHILRDKKRTRWADANGIGVLPAHQGLGASIVLYAEVAITLKNSRFEFVDVVQVQEENQKSRSALEELGVTWHKRHRSYWRQL